MEKCRRYAVWKMPKVCDIENAEGMQYGKCRRYAVWKMLKVCSIEDAEGIQYKKCGKDRVSYGRYI